jgi:anti-sigma factor RsiW
VNARGPATLECREVVKLVTEYLEATLPPEDRARLEQHLLVCPPCTMHVAQVRATVSHLSQLRTSSEVGPALVELFRKWKEKRDDEDA